MNLDAARELKQSFRERVDADAVRPRPALGIAPTGIDQYRIAVRVQHEELIDSEHVATIREASRGEVDVRFVGRIARHFGDPWPRTRQRPLTMGASVGHYSVTAGSIGAFVRDAPGDVMVLSNNHVLADENRAHQGDDVLQPGSADGGHAPDDVIATLEHFVPLEPDGTNTVDCAMARVVDDVDANVLELRGLGSISPPTNVIDVDGVLKIGRTTGLTFGAVTAFDLDGIVVEYASGSLRFDDQMEIASASDDPFSLGGDSGSLIVTRDDLAPVGLLFAGSERGGPNDAGLTYANPIESVLDELDVWFA